MVEVVRTSSLAEAAAEMSPDARFIGGGTLVMRDLNYGDQRFRRVVRTTDPSLKELRIEASRIVLGAGVTMAAILARRDLDFLHPPARSVGGPAVRNMATIGGNLFAPHPYGDIAAALLALDATVELADGAQIGLADLLARRDADAGLVRAVSIARPDSGTFRYRKVSRVKPKGVSLLCMAAWLNRRAGRLADVRLVYGAMALTPVRVPAVERALEGASLDRAGIAQALAVATDGLNPPDDSLASGWYRREVAPVHLRRLLLSEDR
ncbi:MAG: FAD binding domain-containing protein [Pseudomonadota bacterium]